MARAECVVCIRVVDVHELQRGITRVCEGCGVLWRRDVTAIIAACCGWTANGMVPRGKQRETETETHTQREREVEKEVSKATTRQCVYN